MITRKKRILLITDNHDFSGGGAEKYFFELKKQLQQDNTLEVWSLGFGSQAQEGNDFIVLKSGTYLLVRQCWNMFFHPWKYFQLRRAIRKINPDVIHLHNARRYTIALLKALRGYPVVQTVHDYSLICPTLTNLHRDLRVCSTGFHATCWREHQGKYAFPFYWGILFSFWRMKKLIKKRVNQWIAPSPLLADYLQKNGFYPVTYLPPFVTHETEKTTSGDSKKFLYAGQLNKNKGVSILLEEFALAAEKDKSITLKIAGQGPLYATLKTRIVELGLNDRVFFLGWIKDPLVLKKLYEESGAVIFCSLGLEAFGLSMIEAMSHQRAVIGANRGTIAWLVEDQKNGLLFDPLIKGSLANAILKLANNPELAVCYGKEAYQKSQTFPENTELISRLKNIYFLQ